jgi:peptide chain release factor subunit 1
MSINAAQIFKLKKFLKELSVHKARHTEFVSVYVPEGYDITKIINHLLQEKGTAENIKSTGTRKNVKDALERMVQHLRLYKQTPLNGLAAFSGNIAEKEGTSDVQVWSIEPPLPLKMRLYRCDKEFVLDILTDMLDTKEMYGLVVLDRREADLAFLKGKIIIPLTRTGSNVPGKTRAGGQSSARFARLREGAAKEFYRRVAELMKAQFFGKEGLKGIILGGPGPTKYDFLDQGQLTNELKLKIIAIKDLSYTGDFGLEELVDKSQDVLATEAIADEKKIMQLFFTKLSKDATSVSYGFADTKAKLEIGAVDKLLVSEAVDEKIVDELDAKAKEMGTELVLISVDTREGAQLKEMGGFAWILRYSVE